MPGAAGGPRASTRSFCKGNRSLFGPGAAGGPQKLPGDRFAKEIGHFSDHVPPEAPVGSRGVVLERQLRTRPPPPLSPALHVAVTFCFHAKLVMCIVLFIPVGSFTACIPPVRIKFLCVPACLPACMHACVHACMDSWMHACMDACAYARINVLLRSLETCRG